MDPREIFSTFRDPLDPDRFMFRGLHPKVSMGTASDRYAGWIGQIYSEERYTGKIGSRTHKVGGKSYREKVLPVESLTEYFQHFRVLEIDYTFYRPLLDESGKPSQNYMVLKSYRDHLTDRDSLIIKVPQIFFARKILSGRQYTQNTSYLDSEMFTRFFYTPAVELLGDNLRGFIFEQEYQRKEERIPPEDFAKSLDEFFSAIPKDSRYHVELRTESYLAPPVFDVIKKHGIGDVLSHWTWLPPLWKQFDKAGRRFFNSGKQAILRLMTPLGTRYEDAYAKAQPFDKLVPGMLQPQMITDTAKLMQEGINREVQMNVIVNNRAGGNAPLIAQRIARRFLGIEQNHSTE